MQTNKFSTFSVTNTTDLESGLIENNIITWMKPACCLLPDFLLLSSFCCSCANEQQLPVQHLSFASLLCRYHCYPAIPPNTLLTRAGQHLTGECVVMAALKEENYCCISLNHNINKKYVLSGTKTNSSMWQERY